MLLNEKIFVLFILIAIIVLTIALLLVFDIVYNRFVRRKRENDFVKKHKDSIRVLKNKINSLQNESSSTVIRLDNIEENIAELKASIIQNNITDIIAENEKKIKKNKELKNRYKVNHKKRNVNSFTGNSYFDNEEEVDPIIDKKV